MHKMLFLILLLMKNLFFLSDGKLSIGEASASFEGADLLAIETLPITDARLKTAWDHDLYRIRLKMSGTDFQLTVK